MAQSNVLNPHPPEFGQFLYASVGEDRNGYVVTVLSTLARLGLDPWKETADLVALGRGAAQVRLGTLLAQFRDVPALAIDHDSVARNLSQLLPEGHATRILRPVASTVTSGGPSAIGVIWAVLAIVFVLSQILMAGGWEFGE
ncbi:hypothetical protein DKT77_18975 [Meridianimarinicoccus roseus]|uniref:Uncharacterized protein n=1 Tax=Meridianimarinicoccus roseus TaxID=2072018 RepID=A0A2V2L6M7_9RHOB|nr:hypothetical protein [Meridianimarinicoccus roseus]PWR01022.1 hypothetical protein DKT77_18975 [Meridianimarinicoccus roseus]